DINFIVQAIVPLWFYGTPIVYSLNLVPTNLRWLMDLNPLAAIIEMFHWGLVSGGWPSWSMIIANFIIGFVIMISGWFIFRNEAPFFDDWV
ncbi:MAG TPA: hypothetical protein VF465_18230, partial [Flavobacterium sp.]|uniref:ABC transporter permease n=1 Tax=Flavobacterium sp. TaxID=239 RepID=UPI002EE2F702